MHLGGVVDDLVCADAEEPNVHEFHDRAQSSGRCSHPRPDEAGLRDGRVTHPLLPELADQPSGESHRAAPRVLYTLGGPAGPASQVFAHDDDGWIALHLLTERLVHGLYVR